MMDLTGLEREDLVEIITEQATYITKLEAQLQTGVGNKTIVSKATPTKPIIPAPVEVGGSLRRFRFPTFRFEGTVYRADEAVFNNDLLNRIVRTTGNSILKEIAKSDS